MRAWFLDKAVWLACWRERRAARAKARWSTRVLGWQIRLDKLTGGTNTRHWDRRYR